MEAILLSEQITIYELFQKCMDFRNRGIIGFSVPALSACSSVLLVSFILIFSLKISLKTALVHHLLIKPYLSC